MFELNALRLCSRQTESFNPFVVSLVEPQVKIIKYLLLISILQLPQHTRATMIAKGNSSNPLITFTAPVIAKAFDRFNQNFYVGLKPTTGGISGGFAISFFGIASGVLAPIATAIAPTGVNSVNFLTLITAEGEPFPDVAFVPSALPKRTNVLTFNGTYIQLPADLLDAGGASGVNGNVINNIVTIAASDAQIFSAVAPSGGSFGQPNGGIAVVAFGPTGLTIFQTAAQPGDTAVKAARLDPSTPNILIGTTQPTFNPLNKAALFWDSILQRLYIGLPLTSGVALPTDGVISLIVANVTSNGVLNYVNAAPAAAFDAIHNNIVGAVNNGTTVNVSLFNVRTMHCSTGPFYLIVNGGVGAPNNTLFALPLVNVGDPTNPTQGVLANKTMFDSATKQFVVPAVVNADLPLASDPFAVVGAGPLPIQVPTAISDLVVVGDTVYVSFSNVQDNADETGILYSEALFDQNGVISGWTPWSKRAFPYLGLSAVQSTADLGRIKFFDVDALNGKIWAIDGSTTSSASATIATTSWDFGAGAGLIPTPALPVLIQAQQPTNLPAILNQTFPDGCFSVLDLSSATRDLAAELPPAPRYALFGGNNKVAFALISTSLAVNGAQQVNTIFNVPQFFAVSPLPFAGSITSLAYSQQTAPGVNYFFAGSQQGLFVFASNPGGNGFLTSSLGFVNLTPFATGVWTQAPNIVGSVVAMQASGNTTNGCLYVVTTQTSALSGFKSRVYSIPYQATVTAMFAPSNIRLIAESGIAAPGSDLSSTIAFFGIQTVGNGTVEQLVLATTRGVFGSNSNQIGMNGILDATNQTQAAWQLLPGNLTVYSGVFGPSTPVKPTTWPVTFAQANSCATLENSIIRQLSSLPTQGTTPAYGFDPFNFNNSLTSANFATLSEITFFWSDGARRFFVIKRSQDRCGNTKLSVIPYNGLEWGLTAATHTTDLILTDPALADVFNFYWVEQIGMSGILLAGTNSGVVALE